MSLVLEKYTFIFTIINLLVLYFIMKKLLFNKVTTHMENRTNQIKDSIANAEKLNTEAVELKSEYQTQLKSSKTEALQIINAAKLRANKEYENIIEEAKIEAKRIVENAKKDIEREKSQMLSNVKDYITDLTIKTASKLINTNMDTDKNKQLVNKFIEEDGAA